MILAIKADSSEVYVGIYGHDIHDAVAEKSWDSGRELSVQLLPVIENLCGETGKNMSDIEGIIIYQGPGSYTGLRISVSVVNAIGSSFGIPVVGVSGEQWRQDGFELVKKTTSFKPVVPVYGGQVYTTKPRK